jgi:hypothetical protein
MHFGEPGQNAAKLRYSSMIAMPATCLSVEVLIFAYREAMARLGAPRPVSVPSARVARNRSSPLFGCSILLESILIAKIHQPDVKGAPGSKMGFVDVEM